MPGLWGNRWFKNLFSLELGTELMRRYPLGELPERYAPVQRAVTEACTAAWHAPITPCDVVLLARRLPSDRPLGDLEARFQRAPGAVRYCLTPGMSRRMELAR
jgi:hypothetical protein